VGVVCDHGEDLFQVACENCSDITYDVFFG
jgi:hypothetical protein